MKGYIRLRTGVLGKNVLEKGDMEFVTSKMSSPVADSLKISCVRIITAHPTRGDKRSVYTVNPKIVKESEHFEDLNRDGRIRG